MQPFVHAQASARASGRDWRDDLPIHEFMDLAKHACPDLRHRLVLHNADLGPELASRAFPERSDARAIALAHVKQDLGWTPPLSAWLGRVDPARLPRAGRSGASGEDIVRAAAAHHALADPAPVQAVWDFLTLPLRFAPDHEAAARLLLMSGVGPILVRACFGPPAALPRADGGTAVVDFSWVAEGMIVAHAGAILPLERILAALTRNEPERPPELARERRSRAI